MKTLKRVCAALVVGGILASCGGRSPGPGRTTVAVIPKGTSHVFWQSVHAGAARAADELDVDIIWRGPLREDDLGATPR